ncbi:MAG: hypothetical protein M5U01_09970 [Ardenticatenaceae bacterium]|nr:hypothetical protein [Ardenticatenaceae bacterium]
MASTCRQLALGAGWRRGGGLGALASPAARWDRQHRGWPAAGVAPGQRVPGAAVGWPARGRRRQLLGARRGRPWAPRAGWRRRRGVRERRRRVPPGAGSGRVVAPAPRWGRRRRPAPGQRVPGAVVAPAGVGSWRGAAGGQGGARRRWRVEGAETAEALRGQVAGGRAGSWPARGARGRRRRPRGVFAREHAGPVLIS